MTNFYFTKIKEVYGSSSTTPTNDLYVPAMERAQPYEKQP